MKKAHLILCLAMSMGAGSSFAVSDREVAHECYRDMGNTPMSKAQSGLGKGHMATWFRCNEITDQGNKISNQVSDLKNTAKETEKRTLWSNAGLLGVFFGLKAMCDGFKNLHAKKEDAYYEIGFGALVVAASLFGINALHQEAPVENS